jgi:hypothetical protein
MENFIERTHFIERTSIAHFEDLLKAETEPAKRTILLSLLADEKAKQASHVKPVAPGVR